MFKSNTLALVSGSPHPHPHSEKPRPPTTQFLVTDLPSLHPSDNHGAHDILSHETLLSGFRVAVCSELIFLVLGQGPSCHLQIDICKCAAAIPELQAGLAA